ncbi:MULTISPECIES: hypothetical protein [Pseudoalteromonas]|uniref:Uncharacterized protein n=1 Tax=Pseudoalteromonas obscura TaxID=3048491 RepID=A0ABT7ESX1_9GAMM|nr:MULTISPECIES: hypothetical protein [Pseudoalteromonas]MBQ4839324.1 hypothetical protein [Pseudoalteromonas luteoviolacea]MDK2598165.1 hypothetical protein [Pseudoalteromonas sp. P94(2023)]
MRSRFLSLLYDFALESLHNHKRIRNAKVNAKIAHLEKAKSVSTIDWLHVVLLIPCILLFIPFAADHIVQGFAMLTHLPQWYRWLIGLMVLANFGLKLAEKYRI